MLFKAQPYKDKYLLLQLYHSILTTGTLHGQVQPGQTLKNIQSTETCCPNYV